MELKQSEVAEALKIHRNTVKNMLIRGELRGLALEDVVNYAYEKGKRDASCAKTPEKRTRA